MQEQLASYREREKALNEALVTAQQLRSEAQAQADREADLLRREAQSKADRIVEEGERSLQELGREIEVLRGQRRQFIKAFRKMLERYLAELEIEEKEFRELVPERRSASKGGADLARSSDVGARATRSESTGD